MENIIKININKKEDYINKYNNKNLSKDLSNYIINEYKTFNIKNKFHIEITSNYKMEEEEKEKLISMIRANFGTEISEIKEYRNKTNTINTIILIIGIILLILYEVSLNLTILSEFILVFSWILIWESLYNFIFGTFINKIDIKRRKNLTNCKIIFK